MGILNPTQMSSQPQSAGRRRSDLKSSLGGLLGAITGNQTADEFNKQSDAHNSALGNARLNISRDIAHRKVFMNNPSYYEHTPDFMPMGRGYRFGEPPTDGDAPESRAGGSGAPFEGSSGTTTSGPSASKKTRVSPDQFSAPGGDGQDPGTPTVHRSEMFNPPGVPLGTSPMGSF